MHLLSFQAFQSACPSHRPPHHRHSPLSTAEVFPCQEDRRITAGNCNLTLDGWTISEQSDPDLPAIPRRALRGVYWLLDQPDRKSTRLNSSHSQISYAVFCLKKKKAKR